MSVIELNEQNFEKEVLKSDKPFLVDFSAPWCPSCRTMEPIIEEISKEYEGKTKFGQINVDENEKIAEQYNVLSLPTFYLFKKGEKVDEFKGSQAKESVKEIIDKYL